MKSLINSFLITTGLVWPYEAVSDSRSLVLLRGDISKEYSPPKRSLLPDAVSALIACQG